MSIVVLSVFGSEDWWVCPPLVDPPVSVGRGSRLAHEVRAMRSMLFTQGNRLVRQVWAGPWERHRSGTVTSRSLTWVCSFPETHWRVGQNGLRISDAQGGETPHRGLRALWHRRSRPGIRCGHWPRVLFISQTLKSQPKTSQSVCVPPVLTLSTSASGQPNSSYLFPTFLEKV